MPHNTVRLHQGRATQPAADEAHAKPEEMARWPLLECLISADWRDVRRPTTVVIARRSPRAAAVGIGIFLVDLGCLGVRRGNVSVAPAADYAQLLRPALVERTGAEVCAPALAAKVIRAAARYAERLGFEPDKETREALGILGDIDPSACTEPVPLGEDGKPLCMPGPEDDVEAIVARLERQVGKDGFVMLLDDEMPESDEVDGFLPEEGGHDDEDSASEE